MPDFAKLLEAEGPARLQRLADLLEAVARNGSLNRAAAVLGVSYRQSWGLIRRAEQVLEAALLTRRTGGAEGGGAELTEAARDFLRRQRTLQGEAAQIFSGAAPDPGRPILIASTIAPAELGLLDALEAAFHARTGLWVRHIAAGTGQAMEIARSGRSDLLLTHAPETERRFIDEGWGARRYPIMRNDFLLCGPDEDPAGVRTCPDAATAFLRIASRGALFLSRGDHSGTHLKELEVWSAAGVEPSSPWYRVFARGGQGSGITLREADRCGAYMLVDRATYAAVAPAGLAILLAGDPWLANLFSLISLSPERFPLLNHAGAERFIAWATSAEGQAAIASFGNFQPEGEP